MRPIRLLQLTQAIYFRGINSSRFLDVQPDEYREEATGLWLFDSKADTWLPWPSIFAIVYEPVPDLTKALVKQSKKRG